MEEKVEGNQKREERRKGKREEGERGREGRREREREERESVVKPTTLMDLRVIVFAKALLTLSPNVGHSIVVQSSLHGCQWGLPSGWSATAAEDTGQPSASHPQLCHCAGNTWISVYLAYISQCTTQYTWPTYLSVLLSIKMYSVYVACITQYTTHYI